MSDWSHALTTTASILVIGAVCLFTLVYAKENSAPIVMASIAVVGGLGGYHVARCVGRQMAADGRKETERLTR